MRFMLNLAGKDERHPTRATGGETEKEEARTASDPGFNQFTGNAGS
jgi:hypothetical protein